jgi:hypothetical protein
MAPINNNNKKKLFALFVLAATLAPTAVAAHRHPPKQLHGPADPDKIARHLAKRDALLAKRDLRDAEKLAVKSLKACLENNPGCVACVATSNPGLYVCDTLGQGDNACAFPNWVANPQSDGVVNACTCNDGWGSSKLSFKKYEKQREDFIGDAKFLCKEPCARGTDCASLVFNPASCLCI